MGLSGNAVWAKSQNESAEVRDRSRFIVDPFICFFKTFLFFVKLRCWVAMRFEQRAKMSQQKLETDQGSFQQIRK